jgi:myo-inositol 2-dehydrogenase/D-chiro-inositol 1-dehydrogenase
MINVGVIGAGRIGAIHARNVYENKNTHLQWVSDPISAALEQFKGISERVTNSAEDILADDSVDAIVVCSPTPTHIKMIVKGVRANKKVLCEKPVDLTLEHALKCEALINELKGDVMIGFNRRFDPSFAELKSRLGEIGKIEQVVIFSRDPGAPPVDYVKVSGGIFKDMTIHDFDMARFMLGDFVEVKTIGQNVVDPAIKDVGDFDAAVVTMKSESGATATIVNNRRCVYGYDQRIEVFGENGMLEVANQTATSVKLTLAKSTDAKSRYEDFFLQRYEQAYKLELEAFVDSILNGKPFSPSLSDGVRALELAELALADSVRAK